MTGDGAELDDPGPAATSEAPADGDVDAGSGPAEASPSPDAALTPVADTRRPAPSAKPMLRFPPGSGHPGPRNLSSLQTRIDPIPGFPETGDLAWRASNDRTFLDAVNAYNLAHRYRPGDPGYWTADRLKAQAMRESGGENDRAAFLSDPLQVNNPDDWKDPKPKITGLASPHQPMTPLVSARAAMEWLGYKGWLHDRQGQPYKYLGDERALDNYNGNNKVDAQSGGLRHKQWYGRTILLLANQAEQMHRGSD